ncbi:two-component regulator propeller domain-containing protein [Massilia sp. W12]|uniref:two-component regulator propeller domain-containing protein n=1 Tax=Massilia sp. W12 TaxID=3126507 RepID=UPI0030D1C930
MQMRTCKTLPAGDHSACPAWLVRARSAVVRICCLCLLCAAGLAHGAAPAARWHEIADRVFQHLTAEEGLHYPIITALAQDPIGFLWLGTQGGLARWDGYRMRVYQADEHDPGSLADGFIQVLFIDAKGELWIGARSGGLARYDARLDKFERIPLQTGKQRHPTINAIADDGAGGLWIASNDGLLHRKDGQLRLYASANGYLPNDRVLSLQRDARGVLWIGTRQGLLYWAAGAPRPQLLQLPSIDEVQPVITALYAEAGGEVWAGSSNQGAYLIKHGKAQRVLLQSGADAPAHISTDNITSILPVDAKRVWFGVYGGGLLELARDSGHTLRMVHEPALPVSLLSNTVLALCKDRTGLLWVGGQRGLNRFDPQQQAFLTLYGVNAPTQRRLQLNNAEVSALGLGPGGELLFGLQGRGMNILDWRKGSMQWLPHALDERGQAVSLGFMLAILPQSDGTVWLGSNTGLFRYDMKKHRAQQVNYVKGRQIRVNRILQEGQFLWLGTETGLYRFNPHSGDSQHIKALGNMTILSMTRAADGVMWLGTHGSGLHSYHHASGKTSAFLPEIGDPQALAGGTVTSLLFDARGRLWISTLGGGIQLMPQPGRSREIQRLSRQLGLRQLMTAKLLQDKHGHIWAANMNGLVEIDPIRLSARNWQRHDGVYISAYWADSGVVTAEGDLIFGGMGGATVVRPDLAPKNRQYQAPLVLLQARLGKREFSAGSLAHTRGELELRPGENNLSVEFAALDYVAPQQRRYGWRLEGYDREWQGADGIQRIASYTNLPPGLYTLRLRSKNADQDDEQDWQEGAQSLSVRVLPAWYQSWWFYLTGLLGLGLGLSAVVHMRTALLRQRQRQLQEQVALRTAELQSSNQELHKANGALSQANHELALSVETLRQLGEIGRDITARLEDRSVFAALYQHVRSMFNICTFLLYRYEPERAILQPVLTLENDQPFEMQSLPLNDANSRVARVAREQQELLVIEDSGAVLPDLLPGSQPIRSALFVPLLVEQRVLGVMSVQSTDAQAFGERERLIFRTLCAYGAIALENAHALEARQNAEQQLAQQQKMAALGQLVANVAHEINTPLGAIQASCGNIESGMMSVLADAPQLFAALDAAHNEAFWRLVRQALQAGAPRSARIERALRRKLQHELQQAGYADCHYMADQLVRLQVEQHWGEHLSLLQHPRAHFLLQLASNMHTLLSNAQNIGHAVQHMSKMVSSLRSYAGEGEREAFVEVDLCASLEEAVWQFGKRWGADIEVRREYSLRPKIRAQKQALQQVWAHLLLNAAQAMNGHGLLHLRVRQQDGDCLISLQDNGCGMSAEVQAHIFEPFFTTRSNGEGSGLGLYLAQRIMQRHGASIACDSSPGGGSCFTLCLPLQDLSRQAAG